MGNNGLLDKVAMILVILGGLNMGLVGLLHVDVIAMVLGDMTLLSRVVYVLVGASAAYMLYKMLMGAKG